MEIIVTKHRGVNCCIARAHAKRNLIEIIQKRGDLSFQDAIFKVSQEV